jgi:hypothetical protein
MDVDFNIPDMGNFRISAKNWATVEDEGAIKRNFGETSIYSALKREINPREMLDYYPKVFAYSYVSFSIKSNNNNNNNIKFNAIKRAHALAKYSLLLDILMGYS